MNPSPGRAPLAGVRILALEHWVAMPAATNILAALGAEVIKLEEPVRGDEGRRSLPTVESEGGDPFGSLFLRYNRGKKSIAVDLTRPEGVELVRKLAGHVDVFAENLRAGVAERLGLGASALRALHPTLIYASVSGFGLTEETPYGTFPAFAPAAEAMAGLPQLAQTRDGVARAGTFGAIVDLAAGMNAAIGILAALHGRAHRGEGYQVDISLLDSAIALNDMAIQFAALGEHPDGAVASRVGLIELFRARDGEFVVVAVRPDHLAKLGAAVGEPRWRDDVRFADRRRWHEYVDSVFGPAIERWAATRTAREAAATLVAAGVVAAPSLDAHQLLTDPHVRARGLMAPIRGLERETAVVAPAVKLAGLVDDRDTVPHLGQDTARVLREELGLTERQISELAQRGLINTSRST